MLLWAIHALLLYWILTGPMLAWLKGKSLPSIPNIEWTPMEIPSPWGMVVDPNNDCQPLWREGKLALTIPGTLHELQGSGPKTAPRVLRRTSGDFSIEVDVNGVWAPQTGINPPFAPFHGAGILAWLTDTEFLRLERAKIKVPVRGEVVYVHFEKHCADGGRQIASARIGERDFPTLCLMRHGDRFFALTRLPNRPWQILGAEKLNAPQEVDLGVAAINNTAEPFEVEFQRVRFFQPS
jgi:hypothetical protein